jgi:hypothetical protein
MFNDISNLVNIGSALIQFAEMLDDYEERKLNKQASETAIKAMYSLYKQGKITKKQFLDGIDPILEQGKNITGESQVIDVLEKLLG